MFHKSSYSNPNGECVEVDDGILVRDSQDPGGPVLSFTADAWNAFLAGIK